MPDIIEVISDKRLLRPWFSGPSWDMWRAVLKAVYALPMSKREIELFRSVAGRDPPKKPARGMVYLRSPPTRIPWPADGHPCGDHGHCRDAAAGEMATVLCLAWDRALAQIILRYIRGYFARAPMLKQLVTRQTQDGLELSNGVDNIVATNSYRALRGRTLICVILDEVAFYGGAEAAKSDKDLHAALVPGLATMTGVMLIGTSRRTSGWAGL
jgi:hypothetical protein